MKFTGRFLVLSASSVLATVVVAPVAKLIADGLAQHPRASGWLHLALSGGEYDFGRVYRRLFMVLALVVFLLGRRWLGPVGLLGVRRGSPRLRRLGTGWAVGVGSWAVLLAALALLGQRSLEPAVPEAWAPRLAATLAAALLVAAIEEGVLRGYILGGLARELPRLLAVGLSSALYSALHFLKAAVPVRVGGLEPTIGLTALEAHLRPLARPGMLPPFLGLMLVGVVLAYAYLWSRSLPFAVGLHAGWVFLILNDDLLFREPLGQRGIYGEGGVLARGVGWAFLGLFLALLRPGLRWLAPARGREG